VANENPVAVAAVAPRGGVSLLSQKRLQYR